jgi:hypothetical protein
LFAIRPGNQGTYNNKGKNDAKNQKEKELAKEKKRALP